MTHESSVEKKQLLFEQPNLLDIIPAHYQIMTLFAIQTSYR